MCVINLWGIIGRILYLKNQDTPHPHEGGEKKRGCTEGLGEREWESACSDGWVSETLTRLSYRYKFFEGQNSSVEYEKLLHASLLHCDSLGVFWLERIERAPLVEGTLVLLLQMFGGTTSVWDLKLLVYEALSY